MNKAFAQKLAWSFGRAFAGVFIAGLTGVLAAPDFSTGKAALVALSMASLIAGIRAIQHFTVDKK